MSNPTNAMRRDGPSSLMPERPIWCAFSVVDTGIHRSCGADPAPSVVSPHIGENAHSLESRQAPLLGRRETGQSGIGLDRQGGRYPHLARRSTLVARIANVGGRRFPSRSPAVRSDDLQEETRGSPGKRGSAAGLALKVDGPGGGRRDRWLRDVLDEARCATPASMVRIGVTFADAAAVWLRFIEEDRERKPWTLRDYRSALKAHLLPAFGDQPIESITTEEIERWRRVLVGLSTRSKNKLLIQLHGIFRRVQTVRALRPTVWRASRSTRCARAAIYRFSRPRRSWLWSGPQAPS
jgi:Phage integrase, N-terminal SAM-like domain